eukprot:Skav218941  [mRNA]  locus=scaffold678:178176:190869:- [translate_table: standard]
MCDRSNPANLDHCQQCEKHWTVVWQKSAKRSRSKQTRKEKNDKKDKKHKEDKEMTPSQSVLAGGAEAVFLTNAPWVVSTPQARLQSLRQVEMDPRQPSVPPPPVLPPPPTHPAPAAMQPEVLTAEEQEMLKHLRGLRSLNAELPPQFLAQLQLLEEKEKEQGALKPLSHGHISRLHRLQTQVRNQLNKIQKLDAEWKSFLDVVNNRMGQHVECFRAYRAELVQQYQAKLQDLDNAKQLLSEASRSLVDTMPPAETAPEQPNLEADAQHFHQVLQQAAAVETLSVEDSEEMEPVEEDMNGGPPIKVEKSSTYRPRVAPFRGAASPTKVANLNLKQKDVPPEQARPFGWLTWVPNHDDVVQCAEDRDCVQTGPVKFPSTPHVELQRDIPLSSPDDFTWHLFDAAAVDPGVFDLHLKQGWHQAVIQESAAMILAEPNTAPFSWCRLMKRSAFRGTRQVTIHQRVRFSDTISVQLCDDHQSLRCHVPTDRASTQFRALWHLDGQTCHDEVFMSVGQQWQDPFTCALWGDFVGCFFDHALPCLTRESHLHRVRQFEDVHRRSFAHGLNGWDQITQEIQLHPDRTCHFIETWFLDPQCIRVCIRPRRLLVYADVDADQFLMKVIYAWQDFIHPGAVLTLFPLLPLPDASRATVGHYIVVQNHLPAFGAITLQTNRLPRDRHAVLTEGQAQEGSESEPAPALESSIDANQERSWRSVQVSGLAQPPVNLRVRWDEYEALLRDVSSQLGISWRNLVTVFEVYHVPEDLSNTDVIPLIIRRAQDLIPGDPLRMVLLDVHFHAPWPAGTYEVVRCVKVLAPTLTRAALLDVLGLAPFCHLVHERCLVWHNHRLVPFQDRSHLHLAHADYVKIAIPPWETTPAHRCVAPTRAVAAMALHHVQPRHFDHTWLRTNPQEWLDHMPVRRARLPQVVYIPDPMSDDEVSMFQAVGVQTEPASLQELKETRSLVLPAVEAVPLREGSSDECVLMQRQRGARSVTDADSVLSTPQHSFLTGAHLDQLAERWTLGFQVEYDQAPPQAFFTTWFVSDVLQPLCYDPREVALGPDMVQWEHVLRQTWEDVLNEHMPCHLHIVAHDRLAAVWPHGAGHLLLVQVSDTNLVPTILLETRTTEQTFVCYMMACLCNQLITLPTAQAVVMSLSNICARPVAHVQEVHNDLSQLPASGSSLTLSLPEVDTLFVRTRIMPIDETSDALGLMQVSASTADALLEHGARDQAGSSSSSHCSDPFQCPNCPDCFDARTWLVNHDSLKYCPQSRDVRLCHQSRSWAVDIHQVWGDLFKPDEPFRVLLIYPPPFINNLEVGQAAPVQILIEQGLGSTHAAVLVGQELDSSHQPAHCAVSIPAPCSYDLLLRAAELSPWILDSDQLVAQTNHVLHRHSFRCASGTYIQVLRVPRPPPTDEHSLFQQPLTKLPLSKPALTNDAILLCLEDALELPSSEAFSEAVLWHPPAANISSSVPTLTASDETVEILGSASSLLQCLHRVEHSDSQEDGRPLLVMSYFLRDSQVVRCDRPRLLHIVHPDDVGDWDRAIRQVWRDVMQPGTSLSYWPVMPDPPRNGGDQHMCSLIVTRALPEGFVPVLFSTRVWPGPWEHFAVTAAERLNYFGALVISGQAPLCFRASLNNICQVLCQQHHWRPHDVFHPVPGANIRVEVTEAAASAALDVIQDNVHILDFTPSAWAVLREVHRAMRYTYRGGHIPVHSWFLHHGTFHYCRHSRLLALSTQEDSWAEQVCSLWADVCDPHMAIDAVLAHAPPDRDWTQPRAFHVLFFQAQADFPDCAPIFLILSHGSIPRPRHELALVYDDSVPPIDEPDDTSLMQRTPVNLPVFAPALAVADFARAASDTWDLLTDRLDDQCWSTLNVQTWFIAHHRAPECRHPRTVMLQHGVFDWQEKICDAWRDSLDSHAPVAGVVVDRIHSCLQASRLNIIIWQEPTPGRVVALEVACSQPPASDFFSIRALSMPESVSTEALTALVPHDRNHLKPTSIWFLYGEFRRHHYMALHDGACWTVTFDKVVPPTAGMSLLQRRTRRQSCVTPEVSPSHVDAAAKTVHVPGLVQLQAFLCEEPLCLARSIPCRNRFDTLGPQHRSLVFGDISVDTLRLEIYTDGSHKWCLRTQQPIVAWAYVVVACSSAGSSLLGCASGCVDTLAFDSSQHDAFEGEVFAAYQALAWLCQSAHAHAGLPTVLCMDAFSAMQGIAGFWTIHHRELVSTVVRPMFAAAQELAPLEVRWQPSHSGHPYNDLADHLATLACAGEPVGGAKQLPTPVMCEAMPWLWLAFRHHLHGGVGPVFHDDDVTFPCPPTMADCDVPGADQTSSLPSVRINIDIHMVTLNVTSLQPRRSALKRARAAHVCLLQQQCQTHHIVMLQETRVRNTMARHDGAWLQYAAAAKDGQGGCETAFALDQTALKELGAVCPLKKKGPRRDWMQKSTWELLCLSRRARRQAAQLRTAYRRAVLRHLWSHWPRPARRNHRPCPSPSPQWHHMMLTCEAQLFYTALCLRQKLMQAIRTDEAHFIQQCVADHGKCMSMAHGAHLWKQLKFHLPRWKKKKMQAIRFVDKPMRAWLQTIMTGLRRQIDALNAMWTVDESPTAPDVPDTQFPCRVCAKLFASRKACAVHEQVAHAVAASVRSYMPHGTRCRSCLRDFHTTQKLRQHLQYQANGCRSRLEAVMWPLDPEAVQLVSTVRQKGFSFLCCGFHYSTASRDDAACDVWDWLHNEVDWDNVLDVQWPDPGWSTSTIHRQILDKYLDSADAWFPWLPAPLLRQFRQRLHLQGASLSWRWHRPLARKCIVIVTAGVGMHDAWMHALRAFTDAYDMEIDLVEVPAPRLRLDDAPNLDLIRNMVAERDLLGMVMQPEGPVSAPLRLVNNDGHGAVQSSRHLLQHVEVLQGLVRHCGALRLGSMQEIPCVLHLKMTDHSFRLQMTEWLRARVDPFLLDCLAHYDPCTAGPFAAWFSNDLSFPVQLSLWQRDIAARPFALYAAIIDSFWQRALLAAVQ